MNNAWKSVIVVTLVLAGCSTFRSDLSPEALIIGKTTLPQAVEHFGRPYQRDTVVGPAVPPLTSLLSYGFRKQAPPDLFRGVWKVPLRNLVLEFVNDTLHGYIYNNSTDDHATNFDKHLRWRIALRKTTQSEVLALLGEPSGKALIPTSLFDDPLLEHLRHMMPTNAAEAWCYYFGYSYFKAGLHERFEFYRFLAVYFDATGVVVDKFFSESDKTEPNVTRIFVP